MPLVRISLARGTSPAYRRALADGVHRALVEKAAVPADERLPAAMHLLGLDYARLADQAGHA